jgi:aconitate hydratase
MASNNLIYQSTLSCKGKSYIYFDLAKFSRDSQTNYSRLPFSIRILLENNIRNMNKVGFSQEQAGTILDWNPNATSGRAAVPFLPARVLMQDFTGIPVLNDLTALRAAVQRDGKDPRLVNPRTPSNLVTDHSLQVNAYGCDQARRINEELEFKQNFERYQFLKWSQGAYNNLEILPPGLGICHQVNLEHLARVAFIKTMPDGEFWLYPDTVLGTDSHTTMVNGLGVMGWGVGGIEALAAMLDYPSEISLPDVVGVNLTGVLPENATPTDLTLMLTAKLRNLGVVGKFVEVFGKSVSHLPVETRAMISNMSPESGATMTYFPVDEQTIAYLIRSGRSPDQAELVKEYFLAQALFNDDKEADIEYSQIFDFNLEEVEPVLSGPKLPQQVFLFSNAHAEFNGSLLKNKALGGFDISGEHTSDGAEVELNGEKHNLSHGSILIAAITSCTNTSNPSLIITAALLAKHAAEVGLRTKPWVKTSFAPGSRVVTSYLESASLLTGLNTLGFNIVGYGCTTCIGNSGPIDPILEKSVRENNLVAASVLSGNRNFEGRIHPITQANFLASPPLVVAYALAGNLDFDFTNTPLGVDPENNPIYLKDIYPSQIEVEQITQQVVTSDLYSKNYKNIYHGNTTWNEMENLQGIVFNWRADSTLLKEPDFLFTGFGDAGGLGDIENAPILALLGDSITTDHISPAGRIAPDNPAAFYLNKHGVQADGFISFGARRGNHEVMARGTFSNPRLKNKLVDGKDGGFTRHMPTGEILSIYEAAKRYQEDNTPLIVIAGKAYGTGSSRDMAAKGTYLLGVQAVIAESYERIHRTNLVCMGILPLQFLDDQNAISLGITGFEKFSIIGIADIQSPKGTITVSVTREDGSDFSFSSFIRIDTPLELAYFKAGGLMRKLRADF